MNLQIHGIQCIYDPKIVQKESIEKIELDKGYLGERFLKSFIVSEGEKAKFVSFH